MKQNVNDANAVWEAFLARWPLERLYSLTLEEYSRVKGEKAEADSFTYWIDTKTDGLGSIGRGSSFKFGIYHRSDNEEKIQAKGRIYGDEYGWRERYGKTPVEAFKKVHDEVVKVAKAARAGQLDVVEDALLAPAFKWKIAFLYQDRKNPTIVPIFKIEVLRALADEKDKKYPDLYLRLLQERDNEDLVSYGQKLWRKALGERLKTEDALMFLKERFSLIKEPVQYMAGFKTEAGRQLGLVLRGATVSIFMEPGNWDALAPGASVRESYAKNQPRISSLKANAPKLWVEFPAQKIDVPSMAVLSLLCDAYDSDASDMGISEEQTMSEMKASAVNSYPSPNKILYGPPGTGKTYSTAKLAVEICDGHADMAREDLMARYEELRRDGRVCFVTFHQSYGYEDFVEGLRPELRDGQVSYRVRPGVFREICDAARLNTLIKPGLSGKPLKDRAVYKMSLGVAGTTEGQEVFQECIEKGYVLLGWGENVDFSECGTDEAIRKKITDDRPDIDRPESQARYIRVFKSELQIGDIIVVSQGNRSFRAIGEVTGNYEFLEAPVAGSFHQMRPVRWLAVLDANRAVDEIYDRNFVQSSLYRLDEDGLKLHVLDELLRRHKSVAQPYVLVVDEINRANLSKVFGELITLLEPDKREGSPNCLTVKLPYSGDEFRVPANLYVVGTMNTADRSIALLDTALRRRFEFEELQPDYAALSSERVEGVVDLRALLRAMNERIEYLYDRDHTIGHAYFVTVKTLADLERVFRRKVIPLLQEYFYEDWSKVRLVLNDEGEFITSNTEVPKGLERLADGHDVKPRYGVKAEAFSADAYLNIYQ
ncbi:AAA family ATPase [Paraburkholderia sprentiae WSM5005]|uniref:AAA family ATPase n=1 Tax=Paraburkholderia sprentiae WSM5005 TaxID=754502 RepID=A0A1I9YCN4_9BURK|nr:AAA family ATPase [Paraburkholderia sprentiae]APA84067.1 AAA family ATPase [Paraburkholderia sprentiae WSM5005]